MAGYRGKDNQEFDPSTGMIVQRVMEAQSDLLEQQPTGLGIANAINVSFGPAQGGPSDDVQVDAAGLFTFNTEGFRRVKLVAQFGRSGSPGTSNILFRFLVNGVQIGRSLAATISTADDERYIEVDNWFNIPPGGATLAVQCMRDNSGNNSGGLFAFVPDDEGAGTWNSAPCALLRVEKWIAP